MAPGQKSKRSLQRSLRERVFERVFEKSQNESPGETVSQSLLVFDSEDSFLSLLGGRRDSLGDSFLTL